MFSDAFQENSTFSPSKHSEFWAGVFNVAAVGAGGGGGGGGAGSPPPDFPPHAKSIIKGNMYIYFINFISLQV